MTDEEQKALNESLFKAIRNKRPAEEIKEIIEKGADVNAKNELGKTALMQAETAEKTKLLIEAGADVNACDEMGRSALLFAKTAEQTKLLLEAGADVGHGLGRSALIGAFLNYDSSQAQLLLDEGVDANFVIYGRSALAYVETPELTRTLIAAGADVNARGSDGKTPLMCARDDRQTRLLLEAGADVNAKDDDGNTALMENLHSGNIFGAKLLIEAGADVNAVNKYGESALGYCDSEEISVLIKSVELSDWEEKQRARGLIEKRKANVLKSRTIRKRLKKVSDVTFTEDKISGKEKRTIMSEVGAEIKRRKGAEI